MSRLEPTVPLVASLLVVLATAACSSRKSTPGLRVLSLNPTPGATGVSPDVVLSVEIAEDVDPASVGADQLTVQGALGAVAGVVSYDQTARLVRWQPAAGLVLGMTFQATLHSGIRLLSGQETGGETTWQFTVRQAAVGETLALPIAAAGTEALAYVAVDPTNGNAAVIVGADVWNVSGGAPTHESVGFAVQATAVGDDGSLCVARGNTIGSSSFPGYELQVAVRDKNGAWRQDLVPVVTSGGFGLPRVRGGHGTGFVVTAPQGGPVIYDFTFFGPRSSLAPSWPLISQTGPHELNAVAPFGENTVVRARLHSGVSDWFEFDCATPTPTLVRQWQQPFGEIAADRTGALLILTRNLSTVRLERQLLDGTVTGSQDQPSALHELIGIIPGPGGSAAFRADTNTGIGATFRLDATATAATQRPFSLPLETMASRTWRFFYASSGELWLVARVRDVAQGLDTLQAWRQPPDQDWQGPTELLSAEPGRVLGKPGIGIDDAGRVTVAVPRTLPDEVVVLRAQ